MSNSKKKKTTRYSRLQGLVEDLESSLNDLLSLVHDGQSPGLHPDGPECVEVEQRLDFLKNLLSAEFASNPDRTHHLRHISQRLADLEEAFRDWENDRASTVVQYTGDSLSTCSCTNDSCLDDDDGEGENSTGEISIKAPPTLLGYGGPKEEIGDTITADMVPNPSKGNDGGSESIVEDNEDEDDDQEEEETREIERRKRGWRWRLWWGGLMIVSMVFMVRVSGYFQYHEEVVDFLPTPT